MGFFSWLDAETGISITNRYVEARHMRPAYMLRPDGGAPHEEWDYQGYGVFGGKDAYVHLAECNVPGHLLQGRDEEGVREVGCALEAGYYEHVRDGTRHQFMTTGAEVIDPTIVIHPVDYQTPIAAFGGACANDMIARGELVEREFDIPHPLKFSFRADADYHALPASARCPNQGCG